MPKRVGGARRSAAELFMTPRANKLLGLETKNTSTQTPGQTCQSTAQRVGVLFPRLLCWPVPPVTGNTG
jgi:hypothetical protein